MLKKIVFALSLFLILFSNTVFAGKTPNCFDAKLNEWFLLWTQDCDMSIENVAQFEQFLNANPDISVFVLSNVNSENVSSLANMLATNKTLDTLYFIKAHIGPAELEKIATNKNIDSYALVGNHIDDKSFLALNSNKSIRLLIFGESSVSVDALNKFIDIHPIDFLGLENIALSDTEFNSIIQHIDTQQLTTLFIDNISAKNIAAIKQLNQLNDLMIKNQQISNETMTAISQLQKLNALDLTDNDFNPAAVRDLANLKNLRSLKIINTHANNSLSNFGIGDKGALILAQLPKLVSLTLIDQNITDTGAIAIANSTSSQLNLHSNKVGNAGGIALAHNTRIDDLDISQNLLTDVSAYEFAKTMTLKDLVVCNNDFSLEAISALKNNKLFHKLKVGHCE
ncbi:MAG: leucine-rich repeat domain-containing protein [Gammaproteobacteria bacterium]